MKIKHPERPFVLHIFWDATPKDISKKLNRIKSKKLVFPSDYFNPTNVNDEAYTHDLEDVLPGHFCLQFNHKPSIATLVHEIFHVVAQHMRYVSIELSRETEESYAYMFSWLVDAINKKMFNGKI